MTQPYIPNPSSRCLPGSVRMNFWCPSSSRGAAGPQRLRCLPLLSYVGLVHSRPPARESVLRILVHHWLLLSATMFSVEGRAIKRVMLCCRCCDGVLPLVRSRFSSSQSGTCGNHTPPPAPPKHRFLHFNIELHLYQPGIWIFEGHLDWHSRMIYRPCRTTASDQPPMVIYDESWHE